eukprot:4988246-Pleurochrysis_carterae.AAC.1
MQEQAPEPAFDQTQQQLQHAALQSQLQQLQAQLLLQQQQQQQSQPPQPPLSPQHSTFPAHGHQPNGAPYTQQFPCDYMHFQQQLQQPTSIYPQWQPAAAAQQQAFSGYYPAQLPQHDQCYQHQHASAGYSLPTVHHACSMDASILQRQHSAHMLGAGWPVSCALPFAAHQGMSLPGMSSCLPSGSDTPPELVAK